MRFAILGSGAIGSYVGAALARGGSDVVLIARGAQLAALQANGVRVLSPRVWTRRRAAVLGVVTGAYLVGSAIGSTVLVPHFQNPYDRDYVDNFRADLAKDPNQVVVDGLVPADIVLPLVGDDSLLSRVFAPLPEQPVFDEPSPRMRMVDAEGHLVPVVLAGSIPMQPGPIEGCGYPVTSEETEVPLMVEIRGRLVAHLGYFTDTESTVEVATVTWTARFLARRGPNELWFVLPDEGEPVTELSFRVDGDATVCVADLQVGLPELP